MNQQPLNLEEIEKILDMIAIVGEDFSEEGADEVLRLRKQKFMQELKQRLKSACELYLRYKNRPELLIKEHPEYEKDVENMKWIPNPDFERCRWDKSIEAGKCNICPVRAGCEEGEFIENIYFAQDYNDWLFKFVFKSVLEDDK